MKISIDSMTSMPKAADYTQEIADRQEVRFQYSAPGVGGRVVCTKAPWTFAGRLTRGADSRGSRVAVRRLGELLRDRRIVGRGAHGADVRRHRARRRDEPRQHAHDE